MNEGLSNNWLFTSILLPQRPGLSCRDSNKQCRQAAAARGGAGGERKSEWVCVFWTGRPRLYFKISLTIQQVHQIGRFTFQAPADYIGLHQMQQFHRQLKGEASLTLSWWSSQAKHQHKHNLVEIQFIAGCRALCIYYGCCLVNNATISLNEL